MEFGRVGAGLSLIARVGAVGGCCLALAHCSGSGGKVDPKYGVSASPRLVAFGEPVPKGGGTYRVGKPYTIGGRTFNPEENPNYSAEGTASWYGDDFHGRQTANGEVYDMDSISAAHPTLPIPSYARVTNLANRKSIIVRVNDRGPYHAGRLIDVSARTARLLGFHKNGTARVRVDYVGRASLSGSDDTRLEATLRQGTPAPGPNEIKLAANRAFATQSEAIRGAVPTPPERPFELGQERAGSDRAATRSARRAAGPELASVERTSIPAAPPPRPAARRPGTDTSFAARFEPAGSLPRPPAAQAEPVSAYAAPANGAVVSGRGLY